MRVKKEHFISEWCDGEATVTSANALRHSDGTYDTGRCEACREWRVITHRFCADGKGYEVCSDCGNVALFELAAREAKSTVPSIGKIVHAMSRGWLYWPERGCFAFIHARMNCYIEVALRPNGTAPDRIGHSLPISLVENLPALDPTRIGPITEPRTLVLDEHGNEVGGGT